jgi:hypothetical protein
MWAADRNDPVAEVADRGVAMRSVLTRDEVELLRGEFDALALPSDHGFYASNVHSSRATATILDRRLRSLLQPALTRLVPGHEAFLAAFISKGAERGDRVEYHQDWTYTDERSFRALVVWIPLVDVDEGNGALSVVPGSEHWTTGVRPFTTVQPTQGLHDRLDARARTVPMAAGSALFYDPALIHGSSPNSSAAVRPAVAVGLAPVGAPLVHFRVGEDGETIGYRIGADFFTRVEFGHAPDAAERVRAWSAAVTCADVTRGLDAADASESRTSGRRRRWGRLRPS